MKEKDESTLRVATYNVHRCVGLDRRTSEKRIAKVIAGLSADVVGLQELSLGRAHPGAFDQAARIAQELGWNVLFQPALRNAREDFGDAVISRFPIRFIRAAELPGPAPWYCRETRAVLWAEVETGLGTVQVMNTHLGLGRDERWRQARWLASTQWLGLVPSTVPLVFLGDFNSMRGSRPYDCLATRLRDVGAHLAKKTALTTFPSYFPWLAIDHIFVSEAFHPVHVQVQAAPLARAASDHLPLVADLAKNEDSMNGPSTHPKT